MLETSAIDTWLAAYRHAWQTDDRADVDRLFADDVRYSTAPYREPLRGVDEVAAYWLGEKESGIAWTFAPEVLAREGDLYIVRAVTTYPEGGSHDDDPAQFHNLWLVTLDEDGRAREFLEYFMLDD